MKKTVSIILSSALSLSILSACGSEGSLLTSADTQLQALTFAADAGEFSTNGRFGPGGREGAPGQRPGKMGQQGMKGQGMHGNFLFAGIELTDEQKAEIATLQSAKRSEMEAFKAEAPDESSREAAQTAIESAFLSDSFDADALQASLEANKPDHSARATLEAEYLIKSWNILTSEQQSAVISNVAERAAAQAERMANMELKERPERPEGLSNPLVEKLGLSEDQQAALEAAREANKPEAPQGKNPEALVNALAEGATAAEIVALQSANRPDKNPLQHLATLHGILSADQRQTFVDSGLLKAGPGGKGGPGHPGQMGPGGPGSGKMGHGGHGKHMGGPGGPGFGPAPDFGQAPDFNSGY